MKRIVPSAKLRGNRAMQFVRRGAVWAVMLATSEAWGHLQAQATCYIIYRCPSAQCAQTMGGWMRRFGPSQFPSAAACIAAVRRGNAGMIGTCSCWTAPPPASSGGTNAAAGGVPENVPQAQQADADGMADFNSGDLDTAWRLLRKARSLDPQNSLYRDHFLQVDAAMTDRVGERDVHALMQSFEDARAAAVVNGMVTGFDGRGADMQGDGEEGLPVVDPDKTVPLARPAPEITVPALSRPVQADSTVGKVLTTHQRDLAEVGRKLAQAVAALQRLKGQNKESQQQLDEWRDSSEEASNDAERVGLALLLDLAGADVEDQQDLNKEQREEALNAVLSRISDADQRPQEAMKELYAERDSLERAEKDVDAAGKLETLREKIEDLHKPVTDPRFSEEDVLDMVLAVDKPLEDAIGPFRDLTDAAYTVYKQAVSLDHMAVIEKNQEQSLRAAEALRRTVKMLVARKRALEQSDAKQP
jgi:tetratricopeptide (TPR) repeat protein